MGDFGGEFFNFGADRVADEPLRSNDGSVNDLRALVAVIDNFSTAGEVTVYFPPGVYRLSVDGAVDSLSIPENITLKFANGASLKIDLGVSVSISGDIDAPLWPIFQPPPTPTSENVVPIAGKVILSSRRLTAVYPEWWGVNWQWPSLPTGVPPRPDSSPAMQAAFDAAFNNLADPAAGTPPQPIPVHLSTTYSLSSPLSIAAPPGTTAPIVIRGVQGILSRGAGLPTLAANWNPVTAHAPSAVTESNGPRQASCARALGAPRRRGDPR